MVPAKRLLIFLSIIGILCASFSVAAQPSTLTPSGFVNDFAGIIDAPTESKLTTLLTSFKGATGVEVTVVTTPSLAELPVEDYATTLFEQWGVGQKAKDNGLLLLVAPNEKKMRIEVGYGIEGAINDAVAGRIIRDTMLPFFKQGDYSSGILAGTAESIERINTKYNLGFDIAASGIAYSRPAPHKSSLFSTIIKFLVMIFFIFIFIKNPFAGMFLLMGMGRGRGGSSRSSGFGGGGGFGGFGGGMSGGGGASGSW